MSTVDLVVPKAQVVPADLVALAVPADRGAVGLKADLVVVEVQAGLKADVPNALDAPSKPLTTLQ